MDLLHPRVTLPFPPSAPADPTTTPGNPRSWHLGILLPSRAPRHREELGDGGTRARAPTNHFHVLWAPRAPAAVLCCLPAQV